MQAKIQLCELCERHRESAMNQEIKGRFVNGRVELFEEADLEEGEMVKVIVPLRRKERYEEGFMSTSGVWKDDSEHWEEFLREWYIRRGRINK